MYEVFEERLSTSINIQVTGNILLMMSQMRQTSTPPELKDDDYGVLEIWQRNIGEKWTQIPSLGDVIELGA